MLITVIPVLFPSVIAVPAVLAFSDPAKLVHPLIFVSMARSIRATFRRFSGLRGLYVLFLCKHASVWDLIFV
jgi:hypothetical protein